MITTEVAFARSTWRKSKEFSAGLHDLAQRMPMELVRLYVTEGVRTPRVRIDYYDRIDELRELRREALLAEMRHVETQAESWLEEHPDEAARIAAEHIDADGIAVGPSVAGGTGVRGNFGREVRLDAGRSPALFVIVVAAAGGRKRGGGQKRIKRRMDGTCIFHGDYLFKA